MTKDIVNTRNEENLEKEASIKSSTPHHPSLEILNSPKNDDSSTSQRRTPKNKIKSETSRDKLSLSLQKDAATALNKELTSPCENTLTVGLEVPLLSRSNRQSSSAVLDIENDDPDFSIRVDTAEGTESRKSSSSTCPKSGDLENPFSCIGLMGPNPKRICLIIVILSVIWATFLLGINLIKQISVQENKIIKQDQKLNNLEIKYNSLKHDTSNQIEILNQKIDELVAIMKKKSSVQKKNPGDGRKSNRNGSQSNNNRSKGRKNCRTEQGDKCIFPFEYKGELHYSCVKEWSHPKPWCATNIDPRGKYMKSFWGNCDTTIC